MTPLAPPHAIMPLETATTAQQRRLVREERVSPHHGRATPLTVITPIKPGRTLLQRLVFEVLPRTPWGRSEKLLQLSFIQSARWALITDLPSNGPDQLPERMRYDYLLFESNFNGPLDAYIEAFSEVVPDRMKLVWNTSFGFPQPKPVGSFLRYIRANDFGANHFYSAYPEASNTEILAALQTRDLLRELYDRTAGGTSAEFRARYVEMLTAAQRRPEPLRPTVLPRGDVCGNKYAFTALTPVRPHDVPDLRERLAGLGRDAGSPFAPVPGLHFARWVVIEDVVYEGHPQRRDSWRNAYLLTTTTTDGVTHPLEQLRIHMTDEADEIWGFCIGYPGREDAGAFVQYFQHNQIRTNRFFCGYPDATLEDVKSALAVHAHLVDFAFEHQSEHDDDKLQADFLATFGSDAVHRVRIGGSS
jgi:hypothetical protein